MYYKYFIAISLLLCSCTTNMWMSPSLYKEHIKGIHLNQERNELFVVGKKHGYLFDIRDNFKEVLLHSRYFKLSKSFDNFKLDTTNGISGEVELYTKLKQLSNEQRTLLRSLKFYKENEFLVFKIHITGERFLIEGELPLKNIEEELFVNIEKPTTKIEVAKKIIATPATIAFDTVVLAPTVFVSVLLMAVVGTISGQP